MTAYSYNQDIQDLEYLMSCREYLHNSVKVRENLEKQLDARNARNNLVLQRGSPERKEVEDKLEEVQKAEDSLRKKLSIDFEINDGHQLTKRIKNVQSRYPDYENQIAEMQGQYLIQQHGQQGQAAQQQTPALDKGKGIDYDMENKQAQGQFNEVREESIQKSDFEKAFDTPSHHAHPDSPGRDRKTDYDRLYDESPDSDNKSGGQERDGPDHDM